jgi:hypothetical protein
LPDTLSHRPRLAGSDARIPNPESRIPSAGVAFLVYAALTIALTWPLALGIARHLPGDFGDPLFTSWVLAWDATHLGRGWWNANIFAPHPLALAYSEHFLPQALLAAPIYLTTRNPIAAYNAVFLSTFALSGLGMFLFARELTRSTSAAFVAGLAYAFTPYRIASIPHLQVLSSAWMPFVLYGLRRHFATGGAAPLAGAAAAWVLQNLSCGYYLLFFSPIVALYIAWELTVRSAWRDRRALARIAAACLVVAAATLPFLLPYLELRRLGFSPRSLAETRKFSADVYAYLTADPNLWLTGSIWRAWPRAEGLLFPGATIAALAAVGLLRPTGHRRTDDASRPRRDDEAAPGRPGGAERTALAAAALVFAGVAAALLLGYAIRLPFLKVASFPRVMIVGAVLATTALALSRHARTATAAWLRTPAAWLAVVTIFAVAMSFGPDIRAKGRTVAPSNVYALFYDHVPGFDGLRVPARYAMIAALGLAGLAAFGIAAVAPRRRTLVAIAASGLIALEAIAAPIPIDQNATDYGDASLAPLPPVLDAGPALPAVYRFAAAQLPASAVLLELPLGEPAFDIRYMFYSTTHWRRLVNGYSGGEPAGYQFLAQSLRDIETAPARAWQAVSASAATHAVVHEAFYKDGRGPRVSVWLRDHGAREVAAFESDRVFALR